MTTKKIIYVPEAPLCPRGHGGGGRVVLGSIAVVVAFFWAIGEAAKKTAKTVATPAPKPQVKVVTHTIIKTVASHPLLSGAQIVWIVLIVAVMVVGGISVAARLRR